MILYLITFIYEKLNSFNFLILNKFSNDIDVCVMAARVNANNFKWISDDIKNSLPFAESLIVDHGELGRLELLGQRVLMNYNFCSKVAKISPSHLILLGGDDPIKFLKKHLSKNPWDFVHVSTEMQGNEELIDICLHQDVGAAINGMAEGKLKELISREDHAFLLEAFQRDCVQLEAELFLAKNVDTKQDIESFIRFLGEQPSAYFIKAVQNIFKDGNYLDERIKNQDQTNNGKGNSRPLDRWAIPAIASNLIKIPSRLLEDVLRKTLKGGKSQTLNDAITDALHKKRMLDIKQSGSLSQQKKIRKLSMPS